MSIEIPFPYNFNIKGFRMHHNYSTSPIKVLESAAENWRRPHHFEDEFYEVRARRLEAELVQIKEENLLLRRRLIDTDSNILLLE